jgi:serine/threonine protein kinase
MDKAISLPVDASLSLAREGEKEVAPTLEGQTLGKYRVLEPLGRGGMARVYRAYHPQLDRYVAIKVLRSDLVEDEEFLSRFQREARAVAALRHPNIVQVFDFDVQDDVYYMVMELLAGDTLKTSLNDYRARGECMGWGAIVRVLLDVLDGLAYAHSEGMIHRDIKPANVLLTRRGQAVVADFGIAHIVGGTQHTVTGALMGTLNYMAPEQGLEASNDARSDIYSLGIVFYEMLTQRPPFEADTPLAVLMKHINDPLPLPSNINPAIPAPFERVVLKALAKDPDDRYQSAQEMAQALRKATEQAGIELPERISAPLSSTTSEASPAPAAVLSGAARERITDARFADDDTDANLGQKLAQQRAQERAQQRAQKRAHRRAHKRAPGTMLRLVKAILGAVSLIVISNMVIVWVSMLIGNWDMYDPGWPIQLCLISVAFCMLMNALESIWFLIPTGFMLGNGLIFSYFAFTNHWNLWAFVWPVEPLLIVGVVWLTIRLAGQGDYSRRASRLWARALGGAAAAWSLLLVAALLVRAWW